jgi:hypothetical protein
MYIEALISVRIPASLIMQIPGHGNRGISPGAWSVSS